MTPLLITLAAVNSLTTHHFAQLQCVIDVISNLQSKPASALILFSDEEERAQDAANEITQLFSRSITLKTAQFATSQHIEYPGYTHLSKVDITIWIISPNNFLEQVKIVRDNKLWTPASKMILIMQNNETDMNDIFSMLWVGARAVNVVAISVNNELFTWYPYAKHKCNSNITSVSIGKCSNNVLNEKTIFPEKIKSNLNNCPVYAVTRTIYPYVGLDEATQKPISGIEVMLINTIIKKYNGKMKYKELLKGAIFYGTPDDNPSGSRAMLKRFEVDLVYASLIATSHSVGYSDFISPPHTNDELCWFIPQPQKIPAFKNLYLVFEKDVWLSVLLAMICIIATMVISDILHNGVPQPALQIINALAITLNLSISPLPRTRIIKSLWTVCFLYGVHVATAYQSTLYSFLTRPITENAIESVKEAIDRGLIALMSATLKPYVFQKGFPYQKEILSHRHEFVQSFNYDTMNTFEDKVLFGTKSTMLFSLLQSKKVDEHNVLLVRKLEPGVLSLFITFFIARGHPLKSKFDLSMEQLIESGLKEKWMEEFTRSHLGNSFDKFSKSRSALQLSSLSGAFYILFFGLCLAITAYCFEVIYNWVQNKQKTKKTNENQYTVNGVVEAR